MVFYRIAYSRVERQEQRPHHEDRYSLIDTSGWRWFFFLLFLWLSQNIQNMY